jgi:MoxR-like ATPase
LSALNELKQELNAVLKGQEQVTEYVLTGLIAGGHVLLEGVPGLGKTLLLSTLARLIRLDFKRIQFTPDMMPADITGTRIVDEDENGRRSFRFEEGPVFGNLILADEINRATPKTQSALLEAMQEKQVTAGGVKRPLPKPFFVMATQNPIEQEGTYPLPEAQLDRFLMKVLVEFPSSETLGEIIRADTINEVEKIKSVMNCEELNTHIEAAKKIPIAKHVYDYMACIVAATHPGQGPEGIEKYVAVGASPRGALGLRDASRALAYLRGYDHVSVNMVQEIIPVVLTHRLNLSFEAHADGITAGQLLEEVKEFVPEHPEEVADLIKATQS